MKEEDLRKLSLEDLNKFGIKGLEASERLKVWREKNPSKVKNLYSKVIKDWIEANPEEYREIQKLGNQTIVDKIAENPEWWGEKMSKWHRENPEKSKRVTESLTKGAKKWREENPQEWKKVSDIGNQAIIEKNKKIFEDRAKRAYELLPDKEFIRTEILDILSSVGWSNSNITQQMRFLKTDYVICTGKRKNSYTYIKNPDVKE